MISESGPGKTETATDHTCVIGAGLSGVAVAASLRARGLAVTVFDRGDAIGGLWHHTGDTPGPAYTSLHLNTGRDLTGFPDHPMPRDLPRFPRHDQFAEYLRTYADIKGVTEVTELGVQVESVDRAPDGSWIVTTHAATEPARRQHRFGHLVVAAGHHWSPRVPSLQGDETFPGLRIHSYDYSTPVEHADKRVVVVGFGNSAADIAVDLSRIARRTVLVQRRGVHVLPKTLLGLSLDAIANTRWWNRLAFPQQRKLVNFLLHLGRGSLSDYGLAEPDHPLFGSAITLSDELLSRIDHGDIVVKPAITRIDHSTVHFVDGTSEVADELLYCTGYHVEFPFLRPEWVFDPAGRVALYQRVVSLSQPDLYFAGLIRPFGAITHLVHQQAAWIADLISGAVTSPSVEQMRLEVDAHLAAATARYGSAPYASFQVDYGPYLAALRKQRRSSATLAGRGE